MLEKGQLIVWEPLTNNPFSRFDNPMNLVNMHYEGNFILVFEEFNGSKEYTFTYGKNKSNLNSVITFRILDEIARTDIEKLISRVGKDRETQGLSKLTYEPTFYKVKNSSYLSWYKGINPVLFDIHPSVEHHLYITSEFMIDVLSEQEPFITISTKK
ncbi:hypothetical protein H8S33_00405 [Ornithinibacillus sp. BX22]|uniref:Uncharacterized protein n=2 Tax=Ornithinibacillus TaxID=484508 RepID=A0A923RHR3_9BACI|nr:MULTISPECIES: hypothetical protein [Ornithinibacillus]MBC5635272.1 hypothetical protein [Ornithinibacillus hominis]MBS3678842.1 hypothetical protein [Ornithinibacillus massiliensis]